MPDALDADLIRRSLSDAVCGALASLDVLDEVPSTNTWLMQQEQHEPGLFKVALAEHQTAGRGQRSRRWWSPPGTGLCLSLGYTFNKTPSNLSCLTLAAGVAVGKVLTALGVQDLKLKWPNDLYANDAKLGGILTDAQTAAGGRITLICGVGINVDMSAAADGGSGDFENAVTDLRRNLDEVPERSIVAARVIDALATATRQFEEEGLAPFRDEWNKLDWLQGENVAVDMPDGKFSGVADGIDANGALRVITQHGRRRVYTGSVRRVPREAS